MSPRCNLRVRQDRDVGRGRTTDDLAQEHAARAGRVGQLGQRLSVDLLAGHVDVDTFDRHRQQFAVVDLLGAGADQADQHVAAAGHRHDVARLDHGVGRRIHDLAAAPDALDEHALLGQQRLGFLRRLADDRSVRRGRETRATRTGARPCRHRRSAFLPPCFSS